MSVTVHGKKFKCVPDGNGFKLEPEVAESDAAEDIQNREEGTLNGNNEDNVSEEEDVDSDGEVDDDEDDDGDRTSSSKKTGNDKKKVRCTWNHDEEEKFLDLCYDKHIMDKLDGKCGNMPHAKLFKSICVPLNASKLSDQLKSPAQCKSKYKKLKKLYFDAVRASNKSGAGRTTCKHWDKLSRLFSKRPRVECQEWGVDSVNPAQHVDATLGEGEDDPESAADLVSNSTTTSTTATTTSSSTGAGSNPTKPPKYKSVGSRSNPIVSVLQTFMEKSEESSVKQNQWISEQLDKQCTVQKEMFKEISSTLQTGLAALVGVLGSQSAPPSQQAGLFQQQTFMAPPHINFSSISVPQFVSDPNTPGPSGTCMQPASHVKFVSPPFSSPHTQSNSNFDTPAFKTPNKQSPSPTCTIPTTPVRTSTTITFGTHQSQSSSSASSISSTPRTPRTASRPSQSPNLVIPTTPVSVRPAISGITVQAQNTVRRPLLMSPAGQRPRQGATAVVRMENGKIFIQKTNEQGKSS